LIQHTTRGVAVQQPGKTYRANRRIKAMLFMTRTLDWDYFKYLHQNRLN
jgi:hypothetical protein